MKSCAYLVGCSLAVALSNAALGQTYSGGGGTIADSVGLPASSTFQIIVGTGAGTVTGLDVVTLIGLTHSYGGDLSAQLRHQGADGNWVSVDLFERIGYPTSGIYGDSSNFGGDYSFRDSSISSIWNAASAVGDAQAIAAGTYFASRDAGIRVNIAGAFNDMDASGIWELVITDSQQDTQGALGGWQFTVGTVPAPGGIALLGLAVGLAGRGRRRLA